MSKNNFGLIMGINVLRFTLDAATLAAVFFICRALRFPMAVPLLSAAVGLSVVGMIFLELMTKREEKKEAAKTYAYGGE